MRRAVPGHSPEVEPVPNQPARRANAGPQAAMLRLQQAAGNRAAARLIGSERQLMRTPKTPEVDTFRIEVKPGGQGAGIKRRGGGQTQIFVGDTVIIRARFKNVTKADHDWIGDSIVYGGPLKLVDESWEDDQTKRWVLTAEKVGEASADVQVSIADEENAGEYEVKLRVVSDLQDFTLACIETQSTLREKLDNATTRLNEAAKAFRNAYADQDDVLSKASQREKMFEQMIWGVLFAAAGGWAGGTVGAMLKGWTKVGEGGKAVQILADPIIDAAKDTTKFAVRSGQQLQSAGGKSPTPGDSTDPSVTDPVRSGGGRYSPAGEHPQDFLTSLSAKVSDEGKQAQKALTGVIQKAREARSTETNVVFSEDPVSIVLRDRTLDRLAKELNTDKGQYLAALWKAYVMENGAYGGIASMKIYDAVDKAAKAVGESAEKWHYEFMATYWASHGGRADYTKFDREHRVQRPL